jgi:arylsulfatase A
LDFALQKYPSGQANFAAAHSRRMKSRTLGSRLSSILVVAVAAASAADKPNLVFILCDDLGYGDVSCLNRDGKITTPHMDRMAREGMLFTDAHSGSSVCSPTRYGVITGRYAWRSRLKSGVLGGLSPRLIEPGRMTVADMLKAQGYHTAVIGKWHLGMDWEKKGSVDVAELNVESREQVFNVDYAKPIRNGVNSVGFDYYFGISASLDMVPYTYIENDRVTVLPTEDRDYPMVLGREQGRVRKGPAAPDFAVENVLPDLTKKAVDYIRSRTAEAKAGRPFFLYLPLASPHTPIAPTKEWQGKSGLNAYADFVMQTDGGIGQVLKALDEQGLAQNTLVIVTSDNGCSPQADFPALASKGHHPSQAFRGYKADIYEGGHRIPFIVRWPGKVRAGSKSDQTICLTDFMRTVAAILNVSLPDDAAEDSVSILPVLRGSDTGPIREATVHHSSNGSFAIRQGRWKLEFCPGSGGWSSPRPGQQDTSKLPLTQLYDLQTDLAEERNVQGERPEVVARLTELMEKYVKEGRSTPGRPQANNGAVDIWKAGHQAHQPLAAKAKKKKK